MFMLRLFLRVTVRLLRFHNRKSKVAIFNVIARSQPCALPPSLPSIIHCGLGSPPFLNWRLAYVIISNDVFVSISEPYSNACPRFIFEMQFRHVSPQFTVPNGSAVTCMMYMPVSCRDCNEVAFHGDESQQLKREVAFLYPFSFSEAQLPSATTKLLKMKMQLWRF